jgi:hypothetical protein
MQTMSIVPARVGAAADERTLTSSSAKAAKQPFAMVPKVISRDRSLSLGARVSWDLITGYRWGNNVWCDVSIPVLADDLGVTVKRARRFVHELELRGLICVDRPPGRKIRVYFGDPFQTEAPSRIDSPPKRRPAPRSISRADPSQTAPGDPSQTAPPNKEGFKNDKQDIIDNADDTLFVRKQEAEEALTRIGFTGAAEAVKAHGPDLVLAAVALSGERGAKNPPGYIRDILGDPGKYGFKKVNGVWHRPNAEAPGLKPSREEQSRRILNAIGKAIVKFSNDVRALAGERWNAMPGPERGALEDQVFAKCPRAREDSTIKRHAVHLELCKRITGDTSELAAVNEPPAQGANTDVPVQAETAANMAAMKALASEASQSKPSAGPKPSREANHDESLPRTSVQKSAADPAARNRLSRGGLQPVLGLGLMPPRRTHDQCQANINNEAFLKVVRSGGDPLAKPLSMAVSSNAKAPSASASQPSSS